MEIYDGSENLKQNETLELKDKIKIFEEFLTKKKIEESEIDIESEILPEEPEVYVTQPIVNKYPTFEDLNDALQKLKDEKTISECRQEMSEKSNREKERKTHRTSHNRVYDDLHNQLKEIYHQSTVWDDGKVLPQELFVKNFNELNVLRQYRQSLEAQARHFAFLAITAQSMHSNQIMDNTTHINKSIKPKKRFSLFGK